MTWCVYNDGTVWPCKVVRPALWGRMIVCPLDPAPDAGQERTVLRNNVIGAV